MGYLQEVWDESYSKLLHLYFTPYFWKIGRPDLELLQHYKKFEFATIDEIYDQKLGKIRRLLSFAGKFVPFYQRYFEKNTINPDAIRDIETFEEQIPVLTKQDLIQNYTKLKATRFIFPPVIENATGGSTGILTRFLEDRYEIAHKHAVYLLNLSWCGWKPWDRRAYLWGSVRDMEKGWRFAAVERFKNSIRLNSFDMDPAKLSSYYYKLKRFRPRIIIGYAGSLFLFANYLERNGLVLDGFQFSVQSAAETLFPAMREKIEAVFGQPIFNSYGSREISSIAHECPAHQGLHVNELVNHIEVKASTSDDLPSNYGRVIATSLTNFAFPFLRYDMGDIAEVEPQQNCSCGRKSLRLRQILGKQRDFIKTPRGKLIHGGYFAHLFYGYSTIEAFQVIQEQIDHLTVHYKKDPQQSDADIAVYFQRIEKQIKRECDPQFKISFNCVDRIVPLNSGKFKYISSNIS